MTTNDKPLTKIPVPLGALEIVKLYQGRLIEIGQRIEKTVKDLRLEDELKQLYGQDADHYIKTNRQKLDIMIDNAKLYRVEYESYIDFISVLNQATFKPKAKRKRETKMKPLHNKGTPIAAPTPGDGPL